MTVLHLRRVFADGTMLAPAGLIDAADGENRGRKCGPEERLQIGNRVMPQELRHGDNEKCARKDGEKSTNPE